MSWETMLWPFKPSMFGLGDGGGAAPQPLSSPSPTPTRTQGSTEGAFKKKTRQYRPAAYVLDKDLRLGVAGKLGGTK